MSVVCFKGFLANVTEGPQTRQERKKNNENVHFEVYQPVCRNIAHERRVSALFPKRLLVDSTAVLSNVPAVLGQPLSLRTTTTT